MAVFAVTDASVVLNSVDLSQYVKSVNISIEGNDLDTTGMGTTNNSFTTRIIGLKDWSAELELVDDFAAGAVDATVAPLAIAGTSVVLTVKPTSSAVGATNPRYFGNVLVTSANVGGGVGELAMKKVSLTAAGALTRATT